MAKFDEKIHICVVGIESPLWDITFTRIENGKYNHTMRRHGCELYTNYTIKPFKYRKAWG